MSNPLSIVGVVLDRTTGKIHSHVGTLDEVRKWASLLSGPDVSVKISEIGEVVMFYGDVES